MALILEAIVNHAHAANDPDDLTDRVRVDLGRLVCEPCRNEEGLLRIIALEPQLDSQLRQHVHDGTLAVGPGPLSRLIEAVRDAVTDAERTHQTIALLVDQKLRRPLKKILARPTPELPIIAYQELPGDLNVQTVAILPYEQVMGDELNGTTTESGDQTQNTERAVAA